MTGPGAGLVDLSAPGNPAPAIAVLLAALNRFTTPRAVRSWQQTVFTTGGLRLVSPFDGARLAADATLWLDVGCFAYRLRGDGQEAWLVTGGCATGWHICGLFLPAIGLCFAPGANDLVLLRHFLPAVVAAERREVPAQPPTLLVGHENFAHFLWNELPALVAMQQVPAAIGATAVLWEPILPFERLLDWRAGPPVLRTHAAALRPPPERLRPGIQFQLGSTRIPSTVQAHVRAACAPHDPLPPGRPGAAALWLSLRSMYRAPADQLDFCRAVLARLAASGRPLDVYLDGFSPPDDLATAGRYDIARFQAWHRGARALAATLMAGAPAEPRLIDATFCTVPQSIALGARMTAYLCPHGTQQHKIGWLHPVPGVVHTSPHVGGSDQAAWLLDQAEGSARASYLPPSLVASAPGSGARQNDPWYQDYRFVDIDQAAAYAAAALAPHLAG